MRRYWLVVTGMLVLFTALFVAVEALDVPLLTDPGPVLRQAPLAAAAVGVGLLVLDVVLPVPSSVVMIAHGAVFGPLLGAALSLLGSLGAALLGFAVGRRGGPLLKRLVPADERRRADALLARWGVLAIVVTRPVPLLAETTVILAGASALGWRRTAVAALVGSVPAAVLYALAGSVAAGLGDPVAVFTLVLLLAGATWALGAARGRRVARPAEAGPTEEGACVTSTDKDQSWELVADGWHFPTSLALGPDGTVYLAESGLPFAGAPPGGRVWRIDADGERVLLAEDLRAPVNGLHLHDDALFVSEGGHPGRISRLGLDGARTTVLDDLPGPGNYHTNMAVVGPDGKLYFSQGSLTNLGIVGLDAYAIGWLRRLPHGHDIPGYPVTLAGVNVTTPDPTSDDSQARATTGGFSPFGTSTEPGEPVAAALPATAAVMRCNVDGSGLELVAWGLRNAYGLGFLPDGRLLAVDQGADDRGSRAVGNAPDLLFEVQPGRWYGWPDFIAGTRVDDARFLPERGEPPTMLLTDHGQLPPPEPALLEFPPHAAAVKFDVVPASGEHAGDLYVALFGDEVPMTAPSGPRVGRSIARVDTADWTLHPLAPGPPRRPIDVRIDAERGWVYVLDFGQFEMTDTGVDADAGSGAIWRFPLRSR